MKKLPKYLIFLLCLGGCEPETKNLRSLDIAKIEITTISGNTSADVTRFEIHNSAQIECFKRIMALLPEKTAKKINIHSKFSLITIYLKDESKVEMSLIKTEKSGDILEYGFFANTYDGTLLKNYFRTVEVADSLRMVN